MGVFIKEVTIGLMVQYINDTNTMGPLVPVEMRKGQSTEDQSLVKLGERQ